MHDLPPFPKPSAAELARMEREAMESVEFDETHELETMDEWLDRRARFRPWARIGFVVPVA